MKCLTRCVWLILSVVLCSQSMVKSSSVGTFNLRISNTSQIINVTWDKPDKRKSDLCYRTNLQYRSHCDTSWKNYTDISRFYFELPASDMKKNYYFRLRMKLYCTQGDWGEWSPVKHWRNDTGPCVAETSSFSIKDYLLITMLPLAGFVLVYAITQERVRRLVLPIIPDPKHAQERILNVDQFQWLSNFTQTCEECKVSEIKVDFEREEEKTEMTESSLDEQLPQSQPTHLVLGKQGFGLVTNNSMYCIYSSDTPDDNIVPECSHITPGYIII